MREVSVSDALALAEVLTSGEHPELGTELKAAAEGVAGSGEAVELTVKIVPDDEDDEDEGDDDANEGEAQA